MPFRPRLGHQHRPRRPFAAETETAQSTGDRIPQQGLYARMQGWSGAQAPAPESGGIGAGLRHLAGRVIERLKR